ncbi:DUF397 domain-containing protein [Streptomyces tubercidicus]|uniref:DUF397 domain-containing protein n=1 Tax=Streptomyces tubercidicus TaxID=47759 RepID=UPI0036954185
MTSSNATIAYTDDKGVYWHKSSYSGQNNNCIEASHPQSDGTIGVRDTKDDQRATELKFSPSAWSSFVEAARHGAL